ncbi:MAG TPA: biotin--[acetyl-CoA-carboxylase] ligase [Baekduia sp.]|uniref:biotin--[acetyl-CoA-carboxylase] ligase n=1 Tax=Baekduia sp. TaxID=2600305 RepID=UPI002D79D37E|nr:biotin--[acetyl-CoA-carboxylase] ligase [Baekduia sp.]HET6508713.1 biotin--[acetyl-CoA-carboxylase] ligase [Baekduia sp.]
MIGVPRLHLASAGSTSDVARERALAGAPHGALVTAAEQTAGRGRQGRVWTTQPGTALAMSMVVREGLSSGLVTLAAAVAVARACGSEAMIKWPNDVVLDGRKVAGILAEGRPHEGWAVLGIGVNVAVAVEDLPEELRDRAGTLGRGVGDVEPFLMALLAHLDVALGAPDAEVLTAWRARDALLGEPVAWGEGRGAGSGVARGVDDAGHLVVERPDGTTTALHAGEVHLARRP